MLRPERLIGEKLVMSLIGTFGLDCDFSLGMMFLTGELRTVVKEVPFSLSLPSLIGEVLALNSIFCSKISPLLISLSGGGRILSFFSIVAPSWILMTLVAPSWIS